MQDPQITTGIDLIIGKQIVLSTELCRRKCPALTYTIGGGKSPHHAALTCSQCGLWKRWMGATEIIALLKTVELFGWPKSWSSPCHLNSNSQPVAIMPLCWARARHHHQRLKPKPEAILT
jgi:hypothetical protein